MDYNRIDAALRDADDTHHLLIGTGALNELGKLLEQAFRQQSAVVDTYPGALAGHPRASGAPTDDGRAHPRPAADGGLPD